MKNAFFSKSAILLKNTLNTTAFTIILCLTFSACGNQKYYLPGGGRNASGGGCGCPSFSALPSGENPLLQPKAAYTVPYVAADAVPAGTRTSANA